MKKIILIVFLIITITSLTACQNINPQTSNNINNINNYNTDNSNNNYSNNNITKNYEEKTLDVNNFQKLIEQKNNITLIDIRTPSEYHESHIEGAININFYNSDFFNKIKELPSEKTILIYCQSGHRSALALKGLKGELNTNVYDLQGGILSWKKANYNLVSSKTESIYQYS